MKLAIRNSLAAAVVGLSLLSMSAQDAPPTTAGVNLDVSPQRLSLQPAGADWLSYNGDYTGRRYSSLEEINPGNVSHLRTQWVFHARNSDGPRSDSRRFRGHHVHHFCE